MLRKLIAVAVLVSVSAPTWAQYQPVHPPLDCMKRFKLKEYALTAFNYRHGGNRDYSEDFIKTVKGAGFNVLMDQHPALDNAQKHGMWVLVAAIWYDTAKLQALGETVFTHPACVGFNLWDNASGIPRQTRGCANFLKEKYPGLIAYMAENPNAGAQSRTPMRVLSTQNYAFGYNNRGPDNIKRFNFCNSLENDRRASNKLNMTFWPIFASLAGKTVGDTEIRFQTFSPIAYGAQGAMSFAYSVTRPQYNPKTGSVYKAAGWAGRYVNEVAGRHVIGCRSIGVYHSPGGGDTPRGALAPGKGKIIEAMDPSLLAGVLVVENGFENFKAGKSKPAYVMLVDKRTVYYSRPEPPERTVSVRFGPGPQIAEILERKTGTNADKVRIIVPAWTVSLKLKAGDGRLVRLDPPDLATVLPGGVAEVYTRIVAAYGAQRLKIASGEATRDEFEATDKTVSGMLAKAQSLPDKTAGAETLARLEQAVADLRRQAWAPTTADGKLTVVGDAKVQLVCPLKGAPICYTLDGSEPTAQSTRYTAPLTLKKSTTVRAVSLNSKGVVACKPVELRLACIKGASRKGLKINFQPKDFATPAGYLADSGLPYAIRGDQAYGWNMDRTSSAGTRRGGNDPLKKTLVGFIPGAAWEIALENGTYDVTVCIGDADREIWNGSIWADGVELFRDVRLARGASHKGTKTIEVKDGRLTLTSHPRLLDRRLTRINYVIVKRK